MPRVPDASSVTTFFRVNATTTTDPVKKARTFVAPIKQGYLISTLRATDVGQDITPTLTVLSVPTWKSPQFNGRFFLK
jgi:hypothetical protein